MFICILFVWFGGPGGGGGKFIPGDPIQEWPILKYIWMWSVVTPPYPPSSCAHPLAGPQVGAHGVMETLGTEAREMPHICVFLRFADYFIRYLFSVLIPASIRDRAPIAIRYLLAMPGPSMIAATRDIQTGLFVCFYYYCSSLEVTPTHSISIWW